MKVLKESAETKQFAQINVGDCFAHSGNSYLKTQAYSDSGSTEKHNCVRLNDGRYGWFAQDTRVTPHPDAYVAIA